MENKHTFECIILNKIRESNEWSVWSFTTEENLELTTPLSSINGGVKRFGKFDGFNLSLQRGARYIVNTHIEKSKTKDKNGKPYKNHKVDVIYPVLTEEGNRDYLKAIVSEARYKLITSVYPDFIDLIRNGKEIDLALLPGIKEKTFAIIRDKVTINYWKAELMSWLIPLGITEKMIQKLIGKYKTPDALKEALKGNPYILTEIHGLGFYRVDDMVMKMFPEKRVSRERMMAFVTYQLQHIGNTTGHTVISKADILVYIKKSIPECEELYRVMASSPTQELLITYNEFVGLKRYYDAEKYIYEKLKKIADAPVVIKHNQNDYIFMTEEKIGFKLSEEQKEAIESLQTNNLVIIVGSAGVGKTSSIQGIIHEYDEWDILLCSLSAKAADRMREVTGKEAFTIHRALGYDGKGFAYNKNSPLHNKVIILDEASMANLYIFKSLIEAISVGSKLVIVGDDGQLPPIGAGNIFQDLLQSEFKICRLTKIYRQAQRSGIIVDANYIRKGINPFKQ